MKKTVSLILSLCLLLAAAVPTAGFAAEGAGVLYLSTEEGYKASYGAPDPADYGTWVPGIPALAESALDSIDTADWLKGLILDGIIAGVGAVLGFVPQMLSAKAY